VAPRFLLCTLVAGELAACALGAADLPPTQVVTGDFTSASASVSALERQSLAAGPWYCGWGLQDDVFWFGAIPGLQIRRLQDLAAQLSVEYFIQAEEVAALTLHPGLYYENKPDSSCWDIPVDLESGIPISKDFNGAIGFSNARFYHHALPIAGFVWDLAPGVHLQAVYPEPALVITLRSGLELQLAGQLVGGGFETDPEPVRTRVEYYGYQVGANLSYKLRRALTLTLGGGEEVEREFDFFQAGRDLHAGSVPYARLGLEWER
jgi:hypothetical protein